MRAEYRFEQRPAGVSHGHPVLVFDRQGRIHLPLTTFAKSAFGQLASGTARAYLYAVLAFFNFIDGDEWQLRAGRRWDSRPEEVRIAVEDYLVQRLQCKVRDHRLGFQVVAITAVTRSHIRIFLSALKLFYRVTCKVGRYPFDNPLIDLEATAAIAAAEEEIGRGGQTPPVMPQRSGVAGPPNPRRRLSDSYFRLVGEEWLPQIIDDPTFPLLVRRGADRVGWSLRERCVTDLLFDTGARISEVIGLTLGDWVARGMMLEATAFSKGSGGKRVKFLRFGNNTAKLLRRYFNTERCKHDPDGRTLQDYLRLERRKAIDLHEVPIFLTAQSTPLTPKLYRDHYWRPACAAVALDADVHQTRHWYVTMAIRHIFETSTSEAEVARRKANLIAYMDWKSKETIEAYEHHFSALQHVEEALALHARGDRELNRLLEERRRGSSAQQQANIETQPRAGPEAEQDSLDLDFLRKLGGETDGGI